MIPRAEYLEKIETYKDKDIIKVLTGLRRAGKTTIMDLYKEKLLAEGVGDEQIIHINFEDVDYDYIETYKQLHEEIVKRLTPGKMNYIILDEVQRVVGFERAVDSLYLRKNCDVYITGSNSKLLSSDLATLLSGRYVEINILPLSFREFVSTKGGNQRMDMLYKDYVEDGSLPFVTQLEGQWAIRQYLSGIYDSVVLKDIVSRKKDVDTDILRRLIKVLFSSIGSEVSANSIAGTLSSSGRKTAPKTISQYLEYIEASFIFYKAERYDIKGKELLKTNPKYYASELGLRKVVLGNAPGDAGHILENVVYLELIRRGGKVHVGKIGATEVDFVVIGEEGMEYYQVAYSVNDADGSVLQRELRPLLAIKDHNPKYLLTMDYGPMINHDGIRQVYVLDWLLQPDQPW